ncbi:MarR family winged helix-turn-helix transcriptional regulator [Planctellipticum variicoloris]|uniref:MarR family winged helix-turn-helix transcriptional regulator n=1 Tax=Planctellipticum variicoloris TaxID=3064265 RepID=UPI002BD1F03B|nr:MarR family transcriptional regulator [Planctomycetaceae bacterium SH412]HTN01407.1 MarR family transcriptional regulator [Planctomycetaceae bacterium]
MTDAPASAARPRSRRRFDSLEQEAYLHLWRAYDRLKGIEDELFSAHGLSAQQYNALRLLRSVHPGTMPVLVMGSRLISRAPDMTRMLDRLEKRDWVHRERRAENRRVVEVGITPAGIALLDQLADSVRDCHQRQLGHLSPEELQRLVELLNKARAPHEDLEGPWKP